VNAKIPMGTLIKEKRESCGKISGSKIKVNAFERDAQVCLTNGWICAAKFTVFTKMKR
jgi:hypothetical protein